VNIGRSTATHQRLNSRLQKILPTHLDLNYYILDIRESLAMLTAEQLVHQWLAAAGTGKRQAAAMQLQRHAR
jgi:hypothetical protein